MLDKEIPGDGFFVRGTIHQGDGNFSENTRGLQCTAMAAAGIAMSAIKHPKLWTSMNVDEILFCGDELFSRTASTREQVADGEENPQYLTAEELDNKVLMMQNKKCYIKVNEVTFGHLYNNFSEANMPNVENLIETCMHSNTSGILTCNGISIAVIVVNGMVSVFDSHSRGPNGKPIANGTACFTAMQTANQLFDIISSCVPASRSNNGFDGQYQFAPISIEYEDDNIHHVLQDNVLEVTNEEETCEELESNENNEELNYVDDSKDVIYREPLYSKVNNDIIEGCESNELNENESMDIVSITDTQDSDDNNHELVYCRKPLNEGLQNAEVKDENIIMNFPWVWSKVCEEYKDHYGLFSCNINNIKLVSIDSAGLKKYFHFRCDMCSKEAKICSIPNEYTALNFNVAAILGSQSIGIGLFQFEELFGAFGVKGMSFETWQKYHSETTTYIIKAAKISMSKAAEEEKRLAIARNDVVNGIPHIMVEGDGSYKKRSYQNSRYDSPAACVVVIGKHTRKVLQIVVKQKTCSVCDYALSQGALSRNHECFRNHGRDESSTSMESSAMAEIFSSSVQEHNLIYSVLVTDVIVATIRPF